MRGYYKRPEENAKAFTEDGWFRTGDAGLFDQSGALVLYRAYQRPVQDFERKVYRSAGHRRADWAKTEYIEQVAVIGDQRKYVTAIIIPGLRGSGRNTPSRKGITYSSIEELVGELRDTPLHCRAY